MAREIVNDQDLSKVTGGSIMFNEDCSQCGRNCNDEYYVLDFDGVVDYYNNNKNKMSERTMLNHMVELGYLSEI